MSTCNQIMERKDYTSTKVLNVFEFSSSRSHSANQSATSQLSGVIYYTPHEKKQSFHHNHKQKASSDDTSKYAPLPTMEQRVRIPLWLHQQLSYSTASPKMNFFNENWHKIILLVVAIVMLWQGFFHFGLSGSMTITRHSFDSGVPCWRRIPWPPLRII